MSTILIVDDDAAIRAALTALLQAHGHAVLSTGDGADGLDILRTTKPQLAIVDLVMPRLDGIGFLQQARRLAPDMASIALTGGGSAMPPAVSLPLAAASGASATLMKPVTNAELLELIGKLLPDQA